VLAYSSGNISRLFKYEEKAGAKIYLSTYKETKKISKTDTFGVKF